MSVPAVPLIDYYTGEFLKLRREFEAQGNPRAVLTGRSHLINGIVTRLFEERLSPQPSAPENFCVAALGGYGRQELFPHSDLDLLFLFSNQRLADAHREGVAAVTRILWDLHLRVSPTTQTLASCGELHRDNLEFHMALLDCRYLAGDLELFTHLRDDVIPHLVARDRQELTRALREMTRRRHTKHGDTIFHLEPNVKDAPGTLRDYHLCRWLARLAELEKRGRWTPPEDLWPASVRSASLQAFEFLSALRCFLHFDRGRDDNQLSYESQAQAAARGVGWEFGKALPASEWMRLYYRHARAINRFTTRLLDEAVPVQAGLYGLFQDWKSRVANADFSVVRGRIFPRRPAALREDPGQLMSLFEMVARHGLELSREAERAVEEALPHVAQAPRFPELWGHVRQVLILPYASQALREMHRLGLLGALFPEFRAIDALVIRDYFHRYTVDEHSFLTIQNLHSLPRTRASAAKSPGSEWESRFAEILSEVERPGLLFFALLFHDVGKGLAEPDHVQGSLRAVEAIMARLEVPAADRETVRFLITHHLEMSATLQHRDVFDPETVRAFAGTVQSLERLKMLCLLTFADVKAVNPEALAPWKAELLWQLYVATANYLTRSVDGNRVDTQNPEAIEAERTLAGLLPAASPRDLAAFLEGLPRRYLATHEPETIARHFEMARGLAEEPVQVMLSIHPHLDEFTVVTADRPGLFASITGALAAWGMSIVKADAYANAAGVVLDVFRFVDLHRTLQMNPSERQRFTESLSGVVRGDVDLQALLNGRIQFGNSSRPKIKVATQISFDNPAPWPGASSHSTLLELIAQDRPGLLYAVSSLLSELGCNIEVALIDTEGQKALDVFYLTERGSRLDTTKQDMIREALARLL
jgi:[protein-PII] uridylyltransferase